MTAMFSPGVQGITVDLYAGGGGASSGMEAYLGRPVDIAVNHDPAAIAMHEVNHPGTEHYCESIFNVDPVAAVRGRKVERLWLSPDCTHHSKARGGKPVKKSIRGLAHQGCKWAGMLKKHDLHPREIYLENVEEFEHWGPTIAKRCKAGNVMRDKEGTVLEVPCKKRKGKHFKSFVRHLERLGYQVDWRVLNSADFGAHTGRHRFFLIARCDGLPIQWPEPTNVPRKVAKSHFLPAHNPAHEKIDWSIPCPSIFLTRDEAKQQGLRVKRPLVDNTMTRLAKGVKKFVLDNPEPFLVGQTGDTVQAAFIAKHFGGMVGTSITNPFPTITRTGSQNQLVTAFLTRQFGKSIGANCFDPVPTITAGGGGKTAIAACHLVSMRNNCVGSDLNDPAATITAGGRHAGLVAAFLMKYYGQGEGSDLQDPAHTITTKHRFALVTVMIDGEPWAIVDIGTRMLTARELFNLQGFPAEYIIDRDSAGNNYTATSAIARCGNSVPPVMPEVLLRANGPQVVTLAA